AATLGPGAAVLAVGLVALCGAVATLFLRARVVDRQPRRPALLRVARAGLTHLVRTPPLRAATLVSAVSYGCVGLLVVALPGRMAALGTGSASAGYLWTAFECGGVLSILAVGPRLRAIAPERVVYVTVAAYGVLLGTMAVMPTVALTLALAVLAGFAEGPTLPAVFAARQRYSPDDLLAQVATTGVSLKIGMFAVGSALSGTLTGLLGPAGMILLAAGGQLVAVGAGRLVATTTSGGRGPAPSDAPVRSAR
ncbi:MAG TPA: MFS transporter, partial [Pseudonocardiaceae bacterium]|nr:MFS transporter [Pseudonocardiaceae bacterium]